MQRKNSPNACTFTTECPLNKWKLKTIKPDETKKKSRIATLRKTLTANAPVIIINGVIIFNGIKVSGV